MEAVIGFMVRSPGECVILSLSDAPRVAIVSRLPLLAIRSAIICNVPLAGPFSNVESAEAVVSRMATAWIEAGN
jgi:hypothetical protein